MKKSVSTVYGVLLVIGFILMALSFAFTGKKNTSFAEDSRRIELQPDRVVEVSEDVREFYFDSNQMQSEFSELTFFSVHQCVEVYADGEQVYSLEKSSTVFGRTPGTGWNTIQLQEGVKSFYVRIEAVYPAVRDHVTKFYQENDGQMVYQTMRGSVPEIMVSTVDGAIGIMLLIYYVIARRKVKMGSGILYFGIFTLMMGMWSMNEAELVAYMVKSRTAASYTGYMLIMLMIAPFAAFLQEFSEVEEKYVSNIICTCSFANVIVCTVLHMTGICEFKYGIFHTFSDGVRSALSALCDLAALPCARNGPAGARLHLGTWDSAIVLRGRHVGVLHRVEKNGCDRQVWFPAVYLPAGERGDRGVHGED